MEKITKKREDEWDNMCFQISFFTFAQDFWICVIFQLNELKFSRNANSVDNFHAITKLKLQFRVQFLLTNSF